jgi:hypothetical protein
LNAHAQKKTEILEITIPTEKISGCLYKSVRVIDKRIDTTHYGIIQKGAFNRKTKLIAEVPLEQQLGAVISAFSDGTARDGKLVLLLRQFSVAEVTGALSERGYCYLRGILFASVNGGYNKLADVDTVITIGSLDVTKALIRGASSVLTDLFKHNINKAPGDITGGYTFDELVSFDKIEKKGLAVYNTTEYKTGAYKSFESFAKQQPDDEGLLIEFWKSGNVKSVQLKNSKGKFVETDLDKWYALIFENKLYVSTDFGVYPLEKKEDDFYFTGKSRTTAKTGEVVAAQLFFGILGGLMASSGGVGVFDMKIDHLTGGFIHLREVKR